MSFVDGLPILTGLAPVAAMALVCVFRRRLAWASRTLALFWILGIVAISGHGVGFASWLANVLVWRVAFVAVFLLLFSGYFVFETKVWRVPFAIASACIVLCFYFFLVVGHFLSSDDELEPTVEWITPALFCEKSRWNVLADGGSNIDLYELLPPTRVFRRQLDSIHTVDGEETPASCALLVDRYRRRRTGDASSR